MTSSFNPDRSQALSAETQKTIKAFDALDTDAKLAWFYLVYKKMGDSITPAAPTAAEPELAPRLLGDFYQLSNEEQLAIMRQIVNKENTDYSHAYGALKENNQLMVWYAWAQAMGDTVVGMPSNYQASEAINDLLSQTEGLHFEDQISIFRTISSNMGYTDIKPIETQAQTGKTSSL
ncbi:orange carotenoid protein [Chroococcidiopsis sp. FACHB-1243]|uniref:orange carotenoid protein N-terminal domain-containing protein n=1 Tax=Chroococcidiopsis sp. [FACHB-1243] TaxID=2692781 RepID=UPI001786FE02|nr:orange carotenoid protein N-terminal domain-containing protein [Chroococcidiopsis sp. [FACHB-1243]]MBD2306197.1 orange carotenoid protein [Chroococcidiopsis sp. [FACHB-1243]]